MTIRALDWVSSKLGIDVLGTTPKVDESKVNEQEQFYEIDSATGMWKPKATAPPHIHAEYEEKLREMREAANPNKPPPPPPPASGVPMQDYGKLPTERYVSDGYFSGSGSEAVQLMPPAATPDPVSSPTTSQ